MKSSETILLRRIRLLTCVVMAGLLVSGLTAIPLEWELDLAAHILRVDEARPDREISAFAEWIARVRDGVRETNARFPFMAYGTDWLAFGHVVIAVAFLGALRDPVKNRWLFQFGMIACVLVLPWAFVFGALRESRWVGG